jgi:hypothetical protein
MLNYVKGLLSGSRKSGTNSTPPAEPRPAAAAAVVIDGLEPFPIATHLKAHNGFPIVDWEAVDGWLEEKVPEDRRPIAWDSCERAWLLHFRDALGAGFRLEEGRTARVLSSLERNAAEATLSYMERTLKRISAVLDGIVHVPEWGKDLLIIFDDHRQYYDYVSYYYPETGEFALSAGMHIASGCSHFVTSKGDLRSIEPTIAHEMTHGCLAHLPIPAWLNEGIAVNTEHRLAGAGRPLYTPEQMHAKHLRFWGSAEIQEFWSGKSFLRTDDGNMLSYDLARILVDQFARNWERFKAFVLAANLTDSGSAAALEHLEMPLGAAVAAVLEKTSSPDWEPSPDTWEGEAEKGAFRGNNANDR